MSIPLRTLSFQRPEPGSSQEDSLLSHQDEPQLRDNNVSEASSFDSSPRQRREGRWHRQGLLTTFFSLSALSVLAHSILAALHVALIVIMLLRVERGVIIDVGNQTAYWTSVMRIVLQAFAIAYLALLLYLTQRIALRQSLTRSQYLTSSHDQSSAWLGLGSGMKVLYSQTAVNSGASIVVLVVVYLLGSAAIKTTTAALFEFVPINQTRAASQVADQLIDQGNLNWFTYALAREPAPDDNLTSWVSPFLLMSSRGRLDQLGLDGNVVYEVPKPPSSILVNASVNAYSTNVTCGYISYEDQFTFFPEIRQYLHSQRIRAGWLNFGGPVFHYVDLQADVQFGTVLDNLVIFSSFNISDSAGEHASRRDRAGLQIRFTNPKTGENDAVISDESSIEGFPWVYFPESRELLQGTAGNWTRWAKEVGFQTSDDSYQLVGCQSSLQTQSNVTVNGSNGKLVIPPVRKTSSKWSPVDQHVAFDGLNWMFLTGGVAQPGVGDDFGRAASYNTGTSSGVESPKTPLSPAEFWIRNRLNLPIPVDPEKLSDARPLTTSGLPVFQEQQPTIMLHELENALEDYLALSIWSLQQEHPNSTTLLVYENSLVSQLQLIEIPVYAGFAVSCLLLAIACVIIFTPTSRMSRNLVPLNGRRAVHGLSLLEVLWLARAIPELEKIEIPDEQELRKAGLFKVRLLDGLHDRREVVEE
ncbi:hypothetical protein DL96DRAFT_1822426 [Flagelloscypha sp. PMI_526]|nr:hypothetical protein DL96DRAFT_1822426 [Flagelloscypha sp. PMI_526]